MIPHLTVKNNGNIIECCNNTHQGAPHTGKRALALYTSVKPGKLKQFADIADIF